MQLNPFSKPKRRQPVLILTEDARIVGDTFPVDRGYISDGKEREAYFLDTAAQVKPKAGKVSTLVVSERSAIPLYLGVDSVNWSDRAKTLSGQLTPIAKENFERTLSAIPENAVKNKLIDLIRTVVLIFAILAVILIVVGLITSGNIGLPW